MTQPFSTEVAYAQELDAADPLAHFRGRFAFPDQRLIYLDGNSLGRLPAASIDLSRDLVERTWGDRLIRSWNEGWFEAPERVGAKIARLVGAAPDEVIIADSTSVNLFKLVVAALRRQTGRTRIVTDNLNFPSDLYVLQGVIDLLGGQHRLDVIPSVDNIHGPVDALLDALDEDVALLTLTHTVFKSSFIYDMAALTERAHAVGALVLWDLSHSVGSVPVELNGANADLAIGCGYKYLNGGPGAPAFLYVRRDLHDALQNPITGWMGQAHPFDFGLQYRPTPGLRHFLSGTPPVLSLALLEPGVDMLLEAGMSALRAKSLQQTSYLVDLWAALLEPLGYTLNSPHAAGQRGSHVSLGQPEGMRIARTLIEEMNVLPDFRAPDNIRLGLAPLYTSFVDIHTAVQRMQQVVAERLYERYPTTAPVVT